MTESEEQITKILRMIDSAETSLHTARSLLVELAPGAMPEMGARPIRATDARAYESGETQIVEGVFDGQNMIGPNDKIYPLAANYASKSKLVEGDRLKLTIMPNGSFLYKQISPIEREILKGTLVKEDGQFKVLANDKQYRVILASVTYYKGNVGDEVTLLIPKDKESIWGAIEAIIPQVGGSSYSENDIF